MWVTNLTLNDRWHLIWRLAALWNAYVKLGKWHTSSQIIATDMSSEDATKRLSSKKQTLDDAYAAPANFLEIDVINPITHGIGGKRYMYLWLDQSGLRTRSTYARKCECSDVYRITYLGTQTTKCEWRPICQCSELKNRPCGGDTRTSNGWGMS